MPAKLGKEDSRKHNNHKERKSSDGRLAWAAHPIFPGAALSARDKPASGVTDLQLILTGTRNSDHPQRILAHLLRTDLIPEAWAAPQDIRNLRDLLRLRWAFICDQAAAKNRIHVLLAREGLRFQGSDLLGRRGRRWLATLSLRPHVQELVSRLLQHLEETTRHIEVGPPRRH